VQVRSPHELVSARYAKASGHDIAEDAQAATAIRFGMLLVRRRARTYRQQPLGEPTRLQQAPEPALGFGSVKRGLELRPWIRRGESDVVPNKSLISYKSGSHRVLLQVPARQIRAGLRESG
jgi:hypothetical protein